MTIRREAQRRRPPTFPEMIKILFESQLAGPDTFFVQPKWIAGAAFGVEGDFYKLVGACNLAKQEGLILRHLLRLVILSGEFYTQTEDPEYRQLGERVTGICHHVDPRYTDHFLAEAAEVQKAAKL